MAPQDDLTAERAVAVQFYNSLLRSAGVLGYETPRGRFKRLQLLAKHDALIRQEALREAAKQARFGAMELRAMNEPLGTDQRGYGQKALQDFADILDRLASEGG